MSVAIAITTRDRTELTRQTLPPILAADCDIYWMDGSVTEEGQTLPEEFAARYPQIHAYANVRGGSDIAIIYALTVMLEHGKCYDFIGLHENDVLLEDGWLDRVLALFDTPGIPVGAVSARTIRGRTLFALGDRAVMTNLGGGNVLFSRKAAEIVLRNHRTWPTRDVRHVFLTMAGVDIAAPGESLHHLGGTQDDTTTYGSADFVWDPVLALHGLATVAPLPTMARNLDYLTLTYEEEPLPASKPEVRLKYVYNLHQAAAHPPTNLGVILTTTSRMWQVLVQHMPSYMFTGNWTCRHECLRGFAGHVFTSTGAGDSVIIDYVGTECILFTAGVGGSVVVDVSLDDNIEIFVLPSNMQRTAAKRPYGAHRMTLTARGPGVEIFGAVFAERQIWFEPEVPFSFRSLPPIADGLHRNDQIKAALELGATFSTEACI